MLMAVALLVSCTPARVTRGETVTCAARVEPPAQMVVIGLRAEAEGHILRDGAEKHTSGVFLWSGPAAVDTRVTIRARAGTQVLEGAAAFSVAPRELPRLALPDTPPSWAYDAPRPGAPPRISLTDGDGILGATSVELRTPRTKYIEDGPNARWFIVAEPVPQPVVQVSLSRVLKPGEARSNFDCDDAQVDRLREGILRHEGAVASSQPSHYAETRKTFAERDLQGEVEEMRLFYDEAIARDPLQKLVAKKLQAFLDSLRLMQRTSVDRAAPVPTTCHVR